MSVASAPEIRNGENDPLLLVRFTKTGYCLPCATNISRTSLT